jgi:hypothetical protein
MHLFTEFYVPVLSAINPKTVCILHDCSTVALYSTEKGQVLIFFKTFISDSYVRLHCCSSNVTSSHSCHTRITDVTKFDITEVGWPVVVVGFMKIPAWWVGVGGEGQVSVATAVGRTVEGMEK